MKLMDPIAIAVLASAMAIPATAGRHREYHVVPVVTFDHDQTPYGPNVPEGIATSPRGNLYAGMNIGGQLYKVDQDGEVSMLTDLVENLDDGYLLGLAVDADENVYACVWSWNDPSIGGVWRVAPEGQKELVLPMPGMYWESIPNAIAFDPEGNLYVTDSAAASVWRLTPDGEAGLWVQDPLLQGVFSPNGIAYRARSLWLLIPEFGRIVRIPIERDGSPGEPSTFVESPLLIGADGGQFDVAGNMYIAAYSSNHLVRVSPRGDVEVLLTAEQLAPFAWPINPVFGFGRDRSTIFVTGTKPDVVKVDVGIPGMLLPQFSHPLPRH